MDYEELGRQIGALVERKQIEYGDAVSVTADVLKVLYPDGVDVEDFRDLLLVTRVVDKLCRVANGNQGEENAWQDIAGYGLLGMAQGMR